LREEAFSCHFLLQVWCSVTFYLPKVTMQPLELTIEETFTATLRRRLLLYVITGLIIGSAVISYKADAGLRKDVALATTVKPDPVTELYFNNYENLPQFVIPGKTLNFSIHITNHMATTVTYHYVVTELAAGLATPVAGGQVRLVDGQGANEAVHITSLKPAKNTEVVISLQYPAQHIDFWTAAK
jgi:hypothetical protein